MTWKHVSRIKHVSNTVVQTSDRGEIKTDFEAVILRFKKTKATSCCFNCQSLIPLFLHELIYICASNYAKEAMLFGH